eukprot:822667-Pelagomonas_calceolata.AAC.4
MSGVTAPDIFTPTDNYGTCDRGLSMRPQTMSSQVRILAKLEALSHKRTHGRKQCLCGGGFNMK